MKKREILDEKFKAAYKWLRETDIKALPEGDMIVVAPEDAHKPRCAAGHPMAVKKVVVKVAVD